MQTSDPILKMAEKVGELTGVISGLSNKIDGMKDDMKEKIDKSTCENIVHKAIDHHVETSHGKNSRPPLQPLMSAKNKKILIGALSTIATAAAAFLTAKYGV